MSADAYAKLVAHNNTVVQQFKTYKESQERALAEAYSRLAALKEFCAKEREAFEQEKQALLLEKERHVALALDKQALAFEQEKQAMRNLFEQEKNSILVLEKERQSDLILEKQALEQTTPLSQQQIMSNVLTGFFNANQN